MTDRTNQRGLTMTRAEVIAELRDWAATCRELDETFVTAGEQPDRRNETILSTAADLLAGEVTLSREDAERIHLVLCGVSLTHPNTITDLESALTRALATERP